MLDFYCCLNATDTIVDKAVLSSSLEIWYYRSQIFSAIVLVVTFILATFEYYRNKQEYENNRKFNVDLHEYKKREKALELTEFYKNNILGHTLMFNRVYVKIGIKGKLDSIQRDNMVAFDEYELERNLPPADIIWIKEKTKSESFFVALLEHQHIHGKKGFAEGITKCDLDKLEIRDKLGTGYKDAHVKILNNLEFFAMHFINGLANEEIVYQSLHKTYIQIMELFYSDICMNNIKDGSKLFTNAIKLYNKWKSRSEKERRERENAYRKCMNFEKNNDEWT